MFRFTIRDVLWLTVVVACLVVWWIDRTKLLSGFADLRSKNGRLTSRLAELRSENSRLTKGPDWAGMDRIMDQYALHWLRLQEREKELGLEPTPNPFNSPPEPGDPVPKVPPAIFPAEPAALDQT